MGDVKTGFLDDMVSYCLKSAYHKIMEDAEVKLETLGLKVPQFSIMAIVHLNPGITQTKLIDNIYITRSTGSEMIEKLVRRSLIVRKPIDRKSNGLFLSEEGEVLFSNALKMAQLNEKKLTDRFSVDEIKQMNKLLLKLAVNAD